MPFGTLQKSLDSRIIIKSDLYYSENNNAAQSNRKGGIKKLRFVDQNRNESTPSPPISNFDDDDEDSFSDSYGSDSSFEDSNFPDPSPVQDGAIEQFDTPKASLGSNAPRKSDDATAGDTEQFESEEGSYEVSQTPTFQSTVEPINQPLSEDGTQINTEQDSEDFTATPSFQSTARPMNQPLDRDESQINTEQDSEDFTATPSFQSTVQPKNQDESQINTEQDSEDYTNTSSFQSTVQQKNQDESQINTEQDSEDFTATPSFQSTAQRRNEPYDEADETAVERNEISEVSETNTFQSSPPQANTSRPQSFQSTTRQLSDKTEDDETTVDTEQIETETSTYQDTEQLVTPQLTALSATPTFQNMAGMSTAGMSTGMMTPQLTGLSATPTFQNTAGMSTGMMTPQLTGLSATPTFQNTTRMSTAGMSTGMMTPQLTGLSATPTFQNTTEMSTGMMTPQLTGLSATPTFQNTTRMSTAGMSTGMMTPQLTGLSATPTFQNTAGISTKQMISPSGFNTPTAFRSGSRLSTSRRSVQTTRKSSVKHEPVKTIVEEEEGSGTESDSVRVSISASDQLQDSTRSVSETDQTMQQETDQDATIQPSDHSEGKATVEVKKPVPTRRQSLSALTRQLAQEFSSTHQFSQKPPSQHSSKTRSSSHSYPMRTPIPSSAPKPAASRKEKSSTASSSGFEVLSDSSVVKQKLPEESSSRNVGSTYGETSPSFETPTIFRQSGRRSNVLGSTIAFGSSKSEDPPSFCLFPSDIKQFAPEEGSTPTMGSYKTSSAQQLQSILKLKSKASKSNVRFREKDGSVVMARDHRGIQKKWVGFVIPEEQPSPSFTVEYGKVLSKKPTERVEIEEFLTPKHEKFTFFQKSSKTKKIDNPFNLNKLGNKTVRELPPIPPKKSRKPKKIITHPLVDQRSLESKVRNQKRLEEILQKINNLTNYISTKLRYQ